MPTYIQSVDAPIQLSWDSGVTWKTLVCLTNYSAPLAVPTNETDTFCGKLVGTGNAAMDFSGEAVVDATPNSNQVSVEDLAAAELAGTVLQARIAVPGTGSVGSQLYFRSDVIVESVTPKGTANDYIKFDFSLKGQGIPVIAP
jgi:hypothetical protein